MLAYQAGAKYGLDERYQKARLRLGRSMKNPKGGQ